MTMDIDIIIALKDMENLKEFLSILIRIGHMMSP
jgi:hypothetical protein